MDIENKISIIMYTHRLIWETNRFRSGQERERVAALAREREIGRVNCGAEENEGVHTGRKMEV